MHLKLIANNILLFCFFLFLPSPGFTQEVKNNDLSQQTIAELKEYVELLNRVKAEKKDTIGSETRALYKQFAVNSESYRNLLWHFVDDLVEPENSKALEANSQFVLGLLKGESLVIKAEIEKSQLAVTKLENQIISAKKNIFTVNQAVSKDRLSDLQWKLYLKRRNLEELYSALVKNSQKIAILKENTAADLAFAGQLVMKQSDILSGLVGINEDKLLKLEKKLSVVRSESTTGKKLMSDIAFKNLEIQDYASRLQVMVDLLTSMDVDASLYKKTVIQATNSLNTDIFDRRVVSHLFNEWWLSTKKWFSKQAPAIISKVIAFFGIILLAYCIALLVKRMVRGLFQRINPDTSELARKFVVSMSSKIVILIGILIALSNLGVQVGPILAGMGILGFIIGFALQETLSNFASGLMILIYRPYDVGDKIRVSGLEGKVSKMNLVSTTIFTSANHHLTVPNNKIWKDIIHNITSQPQVRLDLFFKAPFNADSETVLTAISEEVEGNPIVLSDKEKNVRIYELGETEVKYIARFWISSNDIDEAKWVISEGVKKRFDEKGISLDIIENLKVRAV